MDSGAVHVWSADVEIGERAASRLAPLLSPEEKARAGRYKSKSRAAQFIVARGLLRRILGEITGVPPSDLRFTTNEHGKPTFAEDEINLHFNVAHSESVALIAITRVGPVGVDIEAIRSISNIERLARRWFSDEDYQYIMHADTSNQDARFFRLWTRKEALLKAWGVGLSWESSRAVNVLNDCVGPPPPDVPGGPARPWGNEPKWSIRSWSHASKYVAAVAAPGESWRLEFHKAPSF